MNKQPRPMFPSDRELLFIALFIVVFILPFAIARALFWRTQDAIAASKEAKPSPESSTPQ
ncbi:hypothetical protein LCGC14_0378490 [marine sediment metagenome]|uniref:Uncharacterized protein n=1 Tax=marine sediment metagenome TaxID=412755 RepID=A0A0F9VQ72_9ZZZZ